MDKKKIIAIAAASVLAAILVVIGIILVVKNGDNKKDNNGKNDKPSSSQSSDDTGIGAELEYEVEKDKEVKPKDNKVKVDVKFNSNPGTNACQLELSYDEKALTLLGVENGEIFDQCESNGNNLLIYSNGIEDIKKTGTLVTLEFEINKNAAKGTYNITFGKETMIVNADEKEIAPKISINSIVVE